MGPGTLLGIWEHSTESIECHGIDHHGKEVVNEQYNVGSKEGYEGNYSRS